MMDGLVLTVSEFLQYLQGIFSCHRHPIHVGCLVVLRFNATLTAKVISCVSWLSHTSTKTNFFSKPPTTFLTCFSRGERRNYAGKTILLKMSPFTFFHVFYAVCTLKSFISHISVIVYIFSEFGTVSKWCIREWVT